MLLLYSSVLGLFCASPWCLQELHWKLPCAFARNASAITPHTLHLWDSHVKSDVTVPWLWAQSAALHSSNTQSRVWLPKSNAGQQNCSLPQLYYFSFDSIAMTVETGKGPISNLQQSPGSAGLEQLLELVQQLHSQCCLASVIALCITHGSACALLTVNAKLKNVVLYRVFWMLSNSCPLVVCPKLPLPRWTDFLS